MSSEANLSAVKSDDHEKENNLYIWDYAGETDPTFSKSAAIGGYEFTSINHLWMVQKATELWGPIGGKWGYKILLDEFNDGAPIYRKINNEEQLVCHESIHTCQIKLYYPGEDGSKNTITEYGHTPYIYSSSFGPKSDPEARKKSLSDAIKKSLSLLGICHDVYMGEFDNPEYVDALKNKFEIEKSVDADEKREELKLEFREWLSSQLRSYTLVPTQPSLDNLHRTLSKKAKSKAESVGIDPEQVIQKVNEAYKKASLIISEKGQQHGK